MEIAKKYFKQLISLLHVETQEKQARKRIFFSLIKFILTNSMKPLCASFLFVYGFYLIAGELLDVNNVFEYLAETENMTYAAYVTFLVTITLLLFTLRSLKLCFTMFLDKNSAFTLFAGICSYAIRASIFISLFPHLTIITEENEMIFAFKNSGVGISVALLEQGADVLVSFFIYLLHAIVIFLMTLACCVVAIGIFNTIKSSDVLSEDRDVFKKIVTFIFNNFPKMNIVQSVVETEDVPEIRVAIADAFTVKGTLFICIDETWKFVLLVLSPDGAYLSYGNYSKEKTLVMIKSFSSDHVFRMVERQPRFYERINGTHIVSASGMELILSSIFSCIKKIIVLSFQMLYLKTKHLFSNNIQ